MNRPLKLADEAVTSRLTALPGWAHQDGKLHREFRFADFSAAFAFMTRVAFLAESHQHHPNWFNVYNRVDIALTTHDAGNVVTEKDRKLAKAIDQLLA